MRTKPNLEPDGEQEITFLDDVDGLAELLEGFTGPEYERKKRELFHYDPAADRALLLSPEEQDVSRLLGTYAVQKPARRRRPRRRGKNS